MSKSSQLYSAITLLFTIAFFGLHFFSGFYAFYIILAVAVVLFIARILRGDD